MIVKMIVANKIRKLCGILICVAVGGLLAFQLLLANHSVNHLFRKNYGDGQSHWQQTSNYLGTINNSLTNTEHSLVISSRLNTVPSLQEDWGKLDCPLEKLSKDKQILYDYLTTITLPCEKEVMVGGKFHKNNKTGKSFFDGEKYLCLDDSFRFNDGNCISLSFGISTDWSYDDEMDKVYGCKVYAFDPTIGLQDHNRSENIKFFNLGISDGPGILKGGKLESYSEILKKLNLENTTIDYLKMDVEGSEWKFFENVLTKTPNLLKKVRQMGMEIHLGGANFAKVWNYFQHLHCFGFRIMFSHYNPIEKKWKVNGKRRAILYEIVWGQNRKW